MSLSKIVVSGKVVRAPEKRFTPATNVAVTEFAIAVVSSNRPDGQAESTPVKVVTWRDLAERCAAEIKKGDLVMVDGRLQINNYSNSEGQKRRDVEIDAVYVENLSATLGATKAGGAEDYVEASVGEVTPRKTAKVGGRQQSEDIDAIFASEDEIPF
jgi:single-strand DNA-binding protein